MATDDIKETADAVGEAAGIWVALFAPELYLAKRALDAVVSL